MSEVARTLEDQRNEFSSRRLLAMPLTGAFVWLLVALSSLVLTPYQTVWVLFIGTGSIIYIAILLSHFVGEKMIDKNRPKNVFDTLFLYTVLSSAVIYSIAIPFFMM
jgi:hypothetical protein